MTSFRKPAALLGLTAAVFAVSTAQADETSTNLDASIKPSSATSPAEKPVTSKASDTLADSEKEGTIEKGTTEVALAPTAEAKASNEGSLAEDEANQPVEGQEVDVRILATTDLHTNLVNYDYYQDKPVENVGLAKTAILSSLTMGIPSKEHLLEPTRLSSIQLKKANNTLCIQHFKSLVLKWGHSEITSLTMD